MERMPPNGSRHQVTAEEQHCQAAPLVSGNGKQAKVILISVSFVFKCKTIDKITTLFFKICFDIRYQHIFQSHRLLLTLTAAISRMRRK